MARLSWVISRSKVSGYQMIQDCRCHIEAVVMRVLMQMMLADGSCSSSPPVNKLPYSSTACSLMNLLSAILSTLALSDAEKRHSSGTVTTIAIADTITSQTSDIVRSLIAIHIFTLCILVNFSAFYILARVITNSGLGWVPQKRPMMNLWDC